MFSPHPDRYCPRVTHIIEQQKNRKEPYDPKELWEHGIGDLEELIWHTAKHFGPLLGVSRVCDFKFGRSEKDSLLFLQRFGREDPCRFLIEGKLQACSAMPDKPKSDRERILYDTQAWFTLCKPKKPSRISFWGFTTKNQYILVDITVGKVKQAQKGAKNGYVLVSAATTVTLRAFPDREAFLAAMKPLIGYEEVWAGLMAFFPHRARMYRKVARDAERRYRMVIGERAAIRKALGKKGE
jgi:hypothetical protein